MLVYRKTVKQIVGRCHAHRLVAMQRSKTTGTVAHVVRPPTIRARQYPLRRRATAAEYRGSLACSAEEMYQPTEDGTSTRTPVRSVSAW